MAHLNGHKAGNGGHRQGEPTDTAPVLDPTFREGDGNVGIIRSPVRAIALPDLRPRSLHHRIQLFVSLILALPGVTFVRAPVCSGGR